MKANWKQLFEKVCWKCYYTFIKTNSTLLYVILLYLKPVPDSCAFRTLNSKAPIFQFMVLFLILCQLPHTPPKGWNFKLFCQNFTNYTYKIFKTMHYALRTCYQPGAPPWWLRTIWSSPTCTCGRYTSWNQRSIRQSSWKSREHFKVSIS